MNRADWPIAEIGDSTLVEHDDLRGKATALFGGRGDLQTIFHAQIIGVQPRICITLCLHE